MVRFPADQGPNRHASCLLRHTGAWKMKSRWIVAATVCLLACGGAVWTGGALLVAPRREPVGEPPLDLPVTALAFNDAGGRTIRGWFVQGVPGQGAVLLLHGVRADRTAMLGRARWLHSQGYSTLLIDFQSAGESDGDAITLGYREADDAARALSWMRLRLPHERIAVAGSSMGGAAILLARPPLRAEALIIEQVYPTIDEAVRDRIDLHLGHAFPFLAPVLLQTMSWHLGFGPKALRPIDHVNGLTGPTLFVAGEKDAHVTLAQSMALYARAGGKKELWIVPGARHVDLYAYDTRAWRTRVGGFLRRSLRTNGEAR